MKKGYKVENWVGNIPEGTKVIAAEAFADCTGLNRIFLPSIEELKSWAFAGCTRLTDIEIPITVKVIGNAFTGCTGLLVKRREDAEKMAARAKELIEEMVPEETSSTTCFNSAILLFFI